MNPYFEQMILSASPIELVRLLYQQAIASVADAREHLREGRIRERGLAIRKAYAIIAELMLALKPEHAPEISENLRKLYCYMQERLLEAHVRQIDGPLEETGRLLATLADGWREEESPASTVFASPMPPLEASALAS
ncbi:MAG TPA: flagellar export chaperone FliS [Bryobacteraceae bacterium]|nr:flagellar export chaperone FliS [Bryobacteraceae bacterium]